MIRCNNKHEDCLSKEDSNNFDAAVDDDNEPNNDGFIVNNYYIFHTELIAGNGSTQYAPVMSPNPTENRNPIINPNENDCSDNRCNSKVEAKNHDDYNRHQLMDRKIGTPCLRNYRGEVICSRIFHLKLAPLPDTIRFAGPSF